MYAFNKWRRVARINIWRIINRLFRHAVLISWTTEIVSGTCSAGQNIAHKKNCATCSSLLFRRNVRSPRLAQLSVFLLHLHPAWNAISFFWTATTAGTTSWNEVHCNRRCTHAGELHYYPSKMTH